MKHDGTTLDQWHPGESAALPTAIARVREARGMDRPPAPGLTRIPTGVAHDVYRQANGEPWYITPEEVRNIERRASKRLGIATDEHIGHGGPRLTIVRGGKA